MKKIIIIITLLFWFLTVWKIIHNNSTSIDFQKATTLWDKDADGINDIDDILAWARKEVTNKTVYKDGYFAGGFPPDGQWVCTDVIWRAFKNAWYDIKTLVDNDIKNNISDYPRVNNFAEPNIDFRRVPNLESYLKKYAVSLDTQVIENDYENLSNWQAWDIIIYGKPKDHIAIISDKRNNKWVPYIIHNGWPVAKENDMLLYWHNNISPIIWHYRFQYGK